MHGTGLCGYIVPLLDNGLLYNVEHVGANIVRPPTLHGICLRAMAAR